MTDVSIAGYAEQLLRDLHMEDIPDADREQVLEMVAGRLQKVVIYTMLENFSGPQKERFAAALADPAGVEDAVAQITAEVPGLSQAVESALLTEYESLKQQMQS